MRLAIVMRECKLSNKEFIWNSTNRNPSFWRWPIGFRSVIEFTNSPVNNCQPKVVGKNADFFPVLSSDRNFNINRCSFFFFFHENLMKKTKGRCFRIFFIRTKYLVDIRGGTVLKKRSVRQNGELNQLLWKL